MGAVIEKGSQLFLLLFSPTTKMSIRLNRTHPRNGSKCQSIFDSIWDYTKSRLWLAGFREELDNLDEIERGISLVEVERSSVNMREWLHSVDQKISVPVL